MLSFLQSRRLSQMNLRLDVARPHTSLRRLGPLLLDRHDLLLLRIALKLIEIAIRVAYLMPVS